MVQTDSNAAHDDGNVDKYPGVIRNGGQVDVSIDGKAFTNLVLSVRLRQYVNDHDVMEAVILGQSGNERGEQGLKVSDAANMLGKSITITGKISYLPGSRESESSLTWTGPVTDVRFESNSSHMIEIVLIATGPTIALDSGRRNAVFTQMSNADVVNNVLGKYSVSTGTKDMTSVSMPFITQYRETDYDFVQRMAALGGAFVHYDGSKVQITKANTGTVATLKWGETLGSFSLSVGARPVKFSTVSRDYIKDAVTSSTKYQVPSLSSQVDQKAKTASEDLFTTAGFVDAASEVDMAGLDRMLENATGRAYGDALQCIGQSVIPVVRAGAKVDIANSATGGESIWVDSVVHYFDDGQYHNVFEGVAVGAAFPKPRRERPRVTDLQTAHVTNLDDPDKYGRVKIKFDWLDTEQDYWVRCASPHAGDGHGWYSRPEVGDEVLVAFENGNPDRPVVLGSMYNGKSTPAQDDTQDNNLKWFLTKTGHKIEFDDKSGEEKITIVTKGDACTIVMDAKEESISITSKKDMTLSGQNITIDAKQKLTLKTGADVEVKAGANLKLEASANADVKASAMMNLKGSMINLN